MWESVMVLDGRWSCGVVFFFFFNDTATTEIYTLSLHDALPIYDDDRGGDRRHRRRRLVVDRGCLAATARSRWAPRSEEHTSELQSRQYLVCRLLLEKKNRGLAVRAAPCRPPRSRPQLRRSHVCT